MIVVDTNILVYFFVSGSHADTVEKVRAADSDWHAPLLWQSEFRNAMAGYLRRGETTLEHAVSTIQRVRSVMDGQEHDVNSAHVMRLVSESRCSAYDCEFVALAQQLNVPLVTSDRRILSDFQSVATTPAQFVV